MKFSYNWLSEYVQLPEPAELKELIELKSFEVEEMAEKGRGLSDKIITAKVVSWQKHPNADRLRVVKLDVGGTVVEPVVCGASNFEAGDIVCLAQPGAIIPHDTHSEDGGSFELGKATIRGVESQGMICSSLELGLGNDHDGILVLPGNTSLGQPVAQVIGDVVFDINVQATNRGDVQCYVGMARELAAISGGKFDEPELRLLKPDSRKKIDIEENCGCLRYSGALLENVIVGDSPEFIKNKLAVNGLGSKNNVVDITNLVMLEYGLPVHAFDADYVENIGVRLAKAGEQLKTLQDEFARELPEGVLVITDGHNPVAAGGVIGGKDSAVRNQTTRVFVEAAKFDPLVVRKSSRLLGIRTDASAKFEKNPSVHMTLVALARAAELLQQHAGARLVEVVDEFPAEKTAGARQKISLAVEQVSRLLGMPVEAADIKKALTSNGFEVSGRDELAVEVPYWRTDISLPEDLIEEAGRLIGYDKIGDQPMLLRSELKIRQDKITVNKRGIQDTLVAAGYTENRNYSFVSEKALSVMSPAMLEGRPELENPMDASQRYMRPSLLVNLLQSAVRNFEKHNRQIKYFEVGNVFGFGSQASFVESTNVCGVAVAKAEPQVLLNEVKAGLEVLSAGLNIKFEYRASVIEPLVSTEQAGGQVIVRGRPVGTYGLISPSLTEELGLKEGYAAYFELEDLEVVLEAQAPVKYNLPAKFPGTSFDISLVVPNEVLWSVFEKDLARLSKGTALKSWQVLQVFRDEKIIGRGKKNLVARFYLQKADGTLTDEEVKAMTGKVQELLKSGGAAIRG